MAAFYKNYILMEETDDKLKLPKLGVMPSESIEDVIRRELYYKSGALIGQSGMLGLLRTSKAEIPLHAAMAVNIEPCSERRRSRLSFVDINSFKYSLSEPFMTQPLINFFLYHSYKLSREFIKKNRPSHLSDLYKRDFYYSHRL